MTYKDIMDMVVESGIPYAYDHFAENDAPNPPYIVFMLPGRDDFLADDSHYIKVTTLTFELYTEYKDPELENRIDSVLESHGVIYYKSEVWIDSEKLYEVRYEMEVIYNVGSESHQQD